MEKAVSWTGLVILWLVSLVVLVYALGFLHHASQMCQTIEAGVKQMMSGVEGGR